ncbi:MAG: OsmC family protein [Myxococcota bacterium]
MAVEISCDYKGELRCESTHGPSGSVLDTDAPVDNQGRGEAFSPTDLLATALASCVLTTLGIKAPMREIEFSGGRARVTKTMSSGGPRRVASLESTIELDARHNERERSTLEDIARNCPVALSLSSETELKFRFVYL